MERKAWRSLSRRRLTLGPRAGEPVALFRVRRFAELLLACVLAWRIIAHAMGDVFSVQEPQTAFGLG